MYKAQELIERYLRNECTDQEKQFLDHWFHHHNLNEKVPLTQKEYAHIRSKLYGTNKPRPLFRNKQLLGSAASIIVVLGLGLYLLNTTFKKNQKELTTNTKRKIEKTLLVVDNMQEFVLGEHEPNVAEVNKLTEADGGTLYAFENKKKGFFQKAVINTLFTPKQQTLKVQLPDGSLVWLNSLSEISFKANFEEDEYREVKLKGEAYFEVAKNLKKPFKVITSDQTVEVLGTHFNVKTSSFGKTSTSLLEGSVAVALKSTAKSKRLILKPGQQSVPDKNSFQVTSFDSDKLLDWKQGDFIFKKDLLSDIASKLAIWYGVELTVNIDGIAEQTFTGRLSRKNTLEESLGIIEKSCNVQFQKIHATKYQIHKSLVD